MKKRTAKIIFFTLIIALLIVPFAAAQEGGQQFRISVDNVSHFQFTDSGVFNTPVGQASPGPALPGNAYQWTFHANPGDHLSFATMFVQSNDWFFGPDELGIPLYNANGSQKSGDVTQYVKLWDAGTEGDETPGSGANQAPRQAGPNTGPDDPNAFVRQVLADGYNASDFVKVNLFALGNGRFTVRIDNISGSSTLPTPLAPGVGVVHSNSAPLFVNGAADYGWGLEALAEDGEAGALGSALAAGTGITTPLAPVAWTVQSDATNPLFSLGSPASPGLELLAEAGGPGLLVSELGNSNSGAAAIPAGSASPGPIGPGGNYSFVIEANPGDHLSLATMFVQSNDWFYGLDSLPLFSLSGQPRNDNVTGYVILYDAGTEVNETPGSGPNQAPRQNSENAGVAEGGVVHTVSDAGFTHPARVIHVTITPLN